MFHVRRLCLVFLVVFLSILQANEGVCRRKYSISREMYARCAEAIAVYVKQHRNWDKGTYTIRFNGIDTFRNSATFGVTSNAVMEEIERKKKLPYDGKWYHDPDDFSVLVDIVDYVVLSENTMDTYFPNARPGYERALPNKAEQ